MVFLLYHPTAYSSKVKGLKVCSDLRFYDKVECFTFYYIFTYLCIREGLAKRVKTSLIVLSSLILRRPSPEKPNTFKL